MEQQALLESIRSNPEEDTPRLMYADWLEEYGSTDQAAATVEFIRVSCKMRQVEKGKNPPNVMPQAAYSWLVLNWKRLVPETLKLHKPWQDHPVMRSYSMPATPMCYVQGRNVKMKIGLEKKVYTNPKVYSCSMELEFWKGLCQDFRCWSNFTDRIIRPVLSKEQPLLGLAAKMKKIRNDRIEAERRQPIVGVTGKRLVDLDWETECPH